MPLLQFFPNRSFLEYISYLVVAGGVLDHTGCQIYVLSHFRMASTLKFGPDVLWIVLKYIQFCISSFWQFVVSNHWHKNAFPGPASPPLSLLSYGKCIMECVFFCLEIMLSMLSQIHEAPNSVPGPGLYSRALSNGSALLPLLLKSRQSIWETGK